jgi:hypothetical protein
MSYEAYIPWPYEFIPNPLNPTGKDFDLRNQVMENNKKLLFDYKNWLGRKYFLTMVNANKVSPVRKENYSLRRIYAKKVDKQFLTVFGDLWGSSTFPKVLHRFSVLTFSIRNFFFPNLLHIYGNLHWKYPTSNGVVIDKQEILQSSKFSIVIENDNSYVSEKLIDSLINGSIPIYLGPQLPFSIIPKDVYIPLPQSPKELILMLQNLQDSELEYYLENIHAFIQSENFISRWERKIVFRQIALELVSCFGDSDE